MSTLYVCKGGILIPRDPQKCIESKPKVISYNHLIRHIPESMCNCKQEKQKMVKEYQCQLVQKDNQIQILVNRIAEKQGIIDKLEEEMSYIKNSIKNTPIIEQSHKRQTIDDINWGEMNKSLNSTVVSCFSLCEQWTNTQKKIQNQQSKTQKQIDDCFKKTNNLMSEIDSIMKKKRKYEFHNSSILVENSIIQQLQMSDQKSQQQQYETQYIQMPQCEDNTFCIPTQSQYNDDFYCDSLDMTTFQSVQNLGFDNQDGQAFYSKLLRDSILLKNTILKMKEQSQQQMNEMQAYYQKQLRISYEELQKERQKSSLFEITKDKLQQISQKGRQALAEIDPNEQQQENKLLKNNIKSSIIMSCNKNRHSPNRKKENVENSLFV